MCCTFLIWTEFNGLPEDMTVDVSHLINKDDNIHKKKPSEIKQSTIKLYKISGAKKSTCFDFPVNDCNVARLSQKYCVDT